MSYNFVLTKSKELHPVTSYQAYCRIERQRDLLMTYIQESLMITDDQRDAIQAHVGKLNKWLKQYRSHVTVKFEVPCTQDTEQ